MRLFFKFKNILYIFHLDGKRIYEGLYNSSVYNPRKGRNTNHINLRIKQDVNNGTIVLTFNPDTIQNLLYSGKSQLLYLEAQKENARIRFASFPKIDGVTDSELNVEPTNFESYSIVFVLFECVF